MGGSTIKAFWNSRFSGWTWPHWTKTLLLTMISGTGLGIILGVTHLSPWPDQGAIQVCDQQVSILLNSHDPVALQRAQYLIQDLHCDVERRLP